MQHYQTIVALHIIFAGIWLIYFAADIIVKRKIETSNNPQTKNEMISLYLQLSNLFGIVGSIGIALTGIAVIIINSGYGFFDMSHAHWLATKQIIFVIILLISFLKIIPDSKKLRTAISNSDSEAANDLLKKVFNSNKIVNILVILNFIFAITHRFYS
ncbi:MAG: hypothetical protein WAR79_03265 [Melioribacteraceae bacterium]